MRFRFKLTRTKKHASYVATGAPRGLIRAIPSGDDDYA
jgi:hypothetical protein